MWPLIHTTRPYWLSSSLISLWNSKETSLGSLTWIISFKCHPVVKCGCVCLCIVKYDKWVIVCYCHWHKHKHLLETQWPSIHCKDALCFKCRVGSVTTCRPIICVIITDIRERFHYVILLSIVVMRNLAQFQWNLGMIILMFRMQLLWIQLHAWLALHAFVWL